MKIFSKHRKKVAAHRRFGSKEFQNKLNAVKNHKRLLNPNNRGPAREFFAKIGWPQWATYFSLLVLAIVLYFLALSSHFVITNIEVSGTSKIPVEIIQSTIRTLSGRIFLMPKNSLFTLNQARLNRVLAEKIPMIREVKSSRVWPNKIRIEVTERNPVLVIIQADHHYLVDDLGFVMATVDISAPQLKVFDNATEEIKVGELLEGKLIPFIISMQKSWPSKLNMGISQVKILGKNAGEVEFVSTEGWSVFFATDRPVSNQLNNLLTLMNKQISPVQRLNLAYIDLRLAKWAYYCFKSTPCQQTDQEKLDKSDSEQIDGVIDPEKMSIEKNQAQSEIEPN